MASPVNGGNQGNGFDQLKAQIQAWIKEEIANALRGGIGLHLDGETGNLIIDQGEIQSGNYVPGSTGWGLLPSGNAEFNALTLRGGIIGDDALANPVQPGTGFQGLANFSVTVAGANIITINNTVPAGFSQVIVFAFGRCAAINSTAAADSLYSAVKVNGVGGSQFGVPVSAGGFNTSSAGYSKLLTGLTAGSNLATSLFASTGTADWAANTANGADLSVSYLWLR